MVAVARGLLGAVEEALAAAQPCTAHEAVCVVLHALMVQAGFVLTTNLGRPVTPSPKGALLPEGWRSTPGFFFFGYGHHRRGNGGSVLDIKIVPMGPHLMIAAMVHAGNAPSLVEHRLRPADLLGDGDGHVKTNDLLSKLPTLSHELSAWVVQPLLNELRTRLLDPSATGTAFELLDLCPELKLAILAFLNETGLCRVARCCSSLSTLARDDTLWESHFKAKYPHAICQAGFAREYRQQFFAEREADRDAEREAERQRRYGGSYMDIPMPGNFPGAGFPGPGGGPFRGGMPGFPPGIIGGDFDRLPGGLLPPFHEPNPLRGGRPGGFGGGFHPPDAVPPGARYDPISPLMDPSGPSGFGGRLGPMGPRGGGGLGPFGGRGPGGRGGMYGGRFDPDSPDFPGIL